MVLYFNSFFSCVYNPFFLVTQNDETIYLDRNDVIGSY